MSGYGLVVLSNKMGRLLVVLIEGSEGVAAEKAAEFSKSPPGDPYRVQGASPY